MAKIELNDWQCKQIIEAIFIDFNDQEKFYERAKKVLNSRNQVLLDGFMNEYFKFEHFWGEYYWFRNVPEDFSALVSEKMQKEASLNLLAQNFKPFVLFTAVNQPEQLNNIINGPLDDTRNHNTDLNYAKKMGDLLAERDGIVNSIGNTLRHIENEKPYDAPRRNLASDIRSRFLSMVENYPLLERIKLFDCGLINKEELIEDCLKFAENSFRGQKCDASNLNDDQIMAVDAISSLLYMITRTGGGIDDDDEQDLEDPCEPNYFFPDNEEGRKKSSYFNQIISALRQDWKYPRPVFEDMLRVYDCENRRIYYKYATPEVLKQEFDMWVEFYKKNNIDATFMYYRLGFILEHVRKKVSEFDYFSDLPKFAEIDYNNCYLYAEALVNKLAESNGAQSAKERAMLDLAIIAGNHSKYNAVSLIRNSFEATTAVKPSTMIDVITADSCSNVADWALRFSYDDEILDSNYRDGYVLLRNIFDACSRSETHDGYADDIIKEINKLVNSDITPKFQTYIALMLNDEKMLSKCFTKKNSKMAFDTCVWFERFSNLDLTCQPYGNEYFYGLSTTNERLKNARNLALKKIDEYNKANNRTQPKEEPMNLTGNALDEILSNI